MKKLIPLKTQLRIIKKWQSFISNFRRRCNLEEDPLGEKSLQKLPEKLKKVKQSIIDVNFDTSQVNKLQSEQDQICMNLYSDLLFLKTFQNNALKLDFDVTSAYEECVKTLSSKMVQINQTALQNLESFLERPAASTKEANEFSNCSKVLLSFQTYVKLPVSGLDLTVFDKRIMERVREIEKQIFNIGVGLDETGGYLIEIKLISSIMPSKKQKIDEILNDILSKYKTRNQKGH